MTDGAVYFLRSQTGRDPRLELHRWDRSTGSTQTILSAASGELSDAERSLRERMRESAQGITAYDVRGDRVVASAGGVLLQWDPQNGSQVVESVTGAFDARVSPDGEWITWVAAGGVHLRRWDGGAPRTLAQSAGDESWGVADFIAAEEFGRSRGYWWLPDSSGLLVQHTDEGAVPVWHRSDPAHPASEPVLQRYPHAGADNAVVSLWRFDLDGNREPVALPHHEYLVSAGSLISVFNREQTELTVCEADGTVVTTLHEQPWLDLVPGLPRRDAAGALLAWRDDDVRRLTVDAVPVTPDGVQLRGLVGVLPGVILVTACENPSESRLARVDADGFSWLSPADSYTTAIAEEGLIVTSQTDWNTYRSTVTIRDDDYQPLAIIENLAEEPVTAADPQIVTQGRDVVQTVVLWPSQPHPEPLPVVMSPYGGPHGQRVVASRSAYASSQWLADQGFCVVVADGRGTPGHDPAWEHAIAGNLLDPPVEDQVRACDAVLARFGDRVDANKVGIIGWSFGGYLAAAAVLLRPDRFHAAVAGAPVTDWRLYDTAYTERYLGDPRQAPEPYDHCSLLPRAKELQRPLMLIHGLGDDNVFAAHTLQLSTHLLHHGRPHDVLPLSGVTHMTPQPDVAENLLLMQVDFLRRALG